jgi:hypothetical protein
VYTLSNLGGDSMEFLFIVLVVGAIGFVAYKKGWLDKIKDKLSDED